MTKCPSCGVDKEKLLDELDDIRHILRNNTDELDQYIKEKRRILYQQ